MACNDRIKFGLYGVTHSESRRAKIIFNLCALSFEVSNINLKMESLFKTHRIMSVHDNDFSKFLFTIKEHLSQFDLKWNL